VDEVNQRIYLEFIPSTAYMHLYFLPMDCENNNHEIILYEGGYEDFQGFIPYLDDDEVREYQGILALDYDHLMSTQAITAMVVAKNPYGSSLPVNVVLDTYTNSQKLPNTYKMIFESTFASIKKKFILDIHVLDVSPPIIIVPDIIEVELSKKRPIGDLLMGVIVTDNIDSLSYLDLVIVEDHYTPKTTLGATTVTIKATDTSGNQTIKVMNINLVDQEGPLLSGPKAIYLYTTDQPLSNAEILAKYDAYDFVDKNAVTIVIQQNLYNQNPNPGMYDLTIVAYDTKMNPTIFPIKIHVIENRGLIFDTNELIMRISFGQEVTDQEIKDWFNQEMSTSGYMVLGLEIIHNEYQLSNQQPGQYYVYIKFNHQNEEHISRILVDIEPKKLNPIWLIPGTGLLVLIATTSYIIFFKKKI